MKQRGPNYQKERGERQQSRILEALAIAPASTVELSELLHMSRSCVHKHLTALQTKPNRRVRVVDFEVVVLGRPRSIYGLGKIRDVTIADVQCKRILAALTEEVSALELIERLNMLSGAVYRYLGQLLAKNKIHIARWDWSNRTSFAIYEKGPGENVPRPTSMPATPVVYKRPPQSIFAALGI